METTRETLSSYRQDMANTFTETDEKFTGNKKDHCNLDSRGKKCLTLVISGLLLIEFVGACDLTLHINFNGFNTICVGTECQNAPLQTFSLNLGQEICFEDQTDGIIKLHISEINIRSRYELKYYTSDYRIVSLNSEGECLGLAGHNTNRHDLCSASERLCAPEKLTALRMDQEQSGGNLNRGTACEFEEKRLYVGYKYIDGFSNTYYPCCQYSWSVESTGKLYPVYSRVGKIWSVKLTASQNDLAQEMMLNAYDPTRSLDGFKLSTNETITLTVLDAKLNEELMFDNLPAHNALLIHDNVGYFINASEIYRPQPELFGDIQVPLKQNELIFSPPKHGVCKSFDVEFTGTHEQTCSCQCTLPDSRISSFLNNLDSFYALNDSLVRKNDSLVIDTFEKLNEGSLKMKMGEWSIDNSSTKKAKCDIEYVTSKGCISCNESSYIILASRNVATEGIIPFYSNCSFDKHYLKCDLVDELKLVLKENYRTCYLKMPTIKKTMLINIEYLNLNHSFSQMQAHNSTALDEKESGSFSPMQANNLTDTEKQELGCIGMSGMFTKSVVIIVILCSTLVLMFTIIVTFRGFKERQQKAENGTETSLVQL